MMKLKIIAVGLLACMVNCEPPVSGYNYQAPYTSFNGPSNTYLPPSNGYSAPSTNYGVPSSNYVAPSTNYGAPSSNYVAPSTNYGAPSSNYVAPSTNYGAPSYNAEYNANQELDEHSHGNHDDHGDHSDHGEPKSYEFGYSVKDAQSGNDYDRHETSDGNVVRGEYRVQLPDGRTQIVTYHADWKTGFHADVRYEGEARYPEPSQKLQQGYNYDTPSDYSGSLTGFHGNGGYKPSTSYGPPSYH